MSDIITGTVTNGVRVPVDFTPYTGLAAIALDETGKTGTIALPIRRPLKLDKRNGFIDGHPAQIDRWQACDQDPKRMTIARFTFTGEAGA